MTGSSNRLSGIEAFKGLACVMVVMHHLAFYGPMSDVIHVVLPGLTAWLYHYGRMAVQVFLVIAGFLAAKSLAPHGVAKFTRPAQLIFRRYYRLMPTYLVALVVCMLTAALVRPWFAHPSVPGAPTLWQMVAHVFLLQDLVGEEALSAGVWYIAIDLQLFGMNVLIFSFAHKVQRHWKRAPAGLGVGLVLTLAALSLLLFNHQPSLSATGLYFFGSYALGMLAYWASSAAVLKNPLILKTTQQWVLVMALLGASTLSFNFSGRITLAFMVALGLVLLQQHKSPKRWLQVPLLVQLGQISYSVFLIHFSVCLLVNAVVTHLWPRSLLVNSLGLLVAFMLSLLAGWALYRGVESKPWAARNKLVAA